MMQQATVNLGLARAIPSHRQQIRQLLGARIRLVRRQRGYSLQGIAERMGLTAAALSLYETGKRSVSVDTLMLICKELGCQTQAILSDDLIADADTLSEPATPKPSPAPPKSSG